ncbi:MAG: heme exporter protein CcmD [Burkholderiaceae bacterium]
MEFDRHTFYIVAAYGMVVIAVLIELWSLRQRRRRATRQAVTIAAVTMPTRTAADQSLDSTESP